MMYPVEDTNSNGLPLLRNLQKTLLMYGAVKPKTSAPYLSHNADGDP